MQNFSCKMDDIESDNDLLISILLKNNRSRLSTESSNSSQWNFENSSMNSIQNDYFKGKKLRTHSLITIRSLLDIKPPTPSSSIASSSTTNQDSDIFCRICHRGDSIDENLLNPCKCRGSIALAHMTCLQRWLTESNRNDCELCRYNYTIIREPLYTVPRSVFVFLRHPGKYLQELLMDSLILIIYTPSAVTSTWMLMTLNETVSNTSISKNRWAAHLLGLATLMGIGIIDFSYITWLILTGEKYINIWRRWYKKQCVLKLILSNEQIFGCRKK